MDYFLRSALDKPKFLTMISWDWLQIQDLSPLGGVEWGTVWVNDELSKLTRSDVDENEQPSASQQNSMK